MEKSPIPLISCLCVTRSKPIYLKLAIDCFRHQTHANKELIIVFEDDDPATRKVLGQLTDKNIKIVEVPSYPKYSLGDLRNISVREAKGEFFCQWDDDDWYHSRRLEVQVNAILLNHKDASVLPYWLMYDITNNQSFMSFANPWPGTIMCRKSIFRENCIYENLKKREDSAFMMQLIKENCIVPVIMPSLYVYNYHANNTWDANHFARLFSMGQRLSDDTSNVFKMIFSGEMQHEVASAHLLSRGLLSQIDYFKEYTLEVDD